MAQKYNTFYVPLADDGRAQDDLNRFLAAHRILSVEKYFAESGWAFCVEWLDGAIEVKGSSSRSTQRVDYREILSEEDFAKFARLREKRKELAKADGVPPYVILTDAQLAEIAKLPEPSLAALRTIPGFGESRIEKYGSAFLSLLVSTDKEQMVPNYAP